MPFLAFLAKLTNRRPICKGEGMATFECEKCKTEIDYKGRVQILDNQGFTHTFCGKCGDDFKRKIDASNASIAETGKPGHLSGVMNRGSSGTFGLFSGKS